MAKKIPFKVSALYFGDKPAGGWTNSEKIRAQGMTYEESYNEDDCTDNGNTGDSVEIDVGLATRQSKIDGILRDADGTPVKGNTLGFTFDGTATGIVSASFDESFEENDLTDTDTVGDGTEFDVDFAKRTLKISAWVKDTTSELARKVVKAATLTLKTGFTLAGNIVITAMTIAGQAKGFFKVDYTANMNTCIKTLPGFPVTGVEKDCMILYKDGATDKAAEGKAIITTLSINSERKSSAKFSFTLKWNGEPTITNYSAV